MTEHITIGDVSPRVQYAADGVQTQFTYPFPIFEAGDLKVWFDETEQTSGFTVSGAGSSSGGTVDFDEAPTDGLLVTLRREVPIERTTDFQEGGAFRARTINDELDRQTAMIQQLAEETGRALLASPTDDSGGLVLPSKATRADRLLGFDSTGAPIAAAGSTGDVAVSAAMKTVVQAATLAAARAALGVAVGADVQGYDAETAKLDAQQKWSARQGFQKTITAPQVIDHRAMVSVRRGDMANRLVRTTMGNASDSGVVAIAFDEFYVYTGGGNNSDNLIRINKIDRETGTIVDTYDGDTSEETVAEIIFGPDGYLYASCSVSPGKVVQIDTSDMSKVDVWTGTSGQNTASGLTADDTYVYVTLYDASPGLVVQIDTSDMTTNATWTGEASYELYPQAVTTDGVYLHVNLDLQPFQIVKVDISTMTKVSVPFADNRFLDSRQAVGDATTTRAAQTVPLTAGDKIYGADLLLDKVGSPTGTASVVVRQSLDDASIGTLGTVDVSTLPSSAALPIWVRFYPASPLAAANTENHYFSIEYSGGDASNYLGARFDSSDRTGGVRATYAGSWATNPGHDLSIRIYPNNRFYAENDSAYNNGDALGDHTIDHLGRIYATTYGEAPDKLIRVNPSIMMEEDQITLNDGETNAVMPVAVDGNIFIPCNVAPGKLVWVEDTPGSGLKRRGCHTGASGKNYFNHVGHDGLYTWFAASIAPPELYRKIIGPIDETAA